MNPMNPQQQHVDRFLADVAAERIRQSIEEGWTVEHDDGHSVADWIMLVTRYLSRMGDAAEATDTSLYYRRLVQTAAILTAQAESFLRMLSGRA